MKLFNANTSAVVEYSHTKGVNAYVKAAIVERVPERDLLNNLVICLPEHHINVAVNAPNSRCKHSNIQTIHVNQNME